MFTYADNSSKAIWNELLKELEKELKPIPVIRKGQGRMFIRVRKGV